MTAMLDAEPAMDPRAADLHTFEAPEPEAPPDPNTLQRLVDRFGRHSGPTRSRKHGHWPLARQHVENALLHHQGVPVAQIAAMRGRKPSAVYSSIARGKQLLAKGLERGAFPILDDDQADDE